MCSTFDTYVPNYCISYFRPGNYSIIYLLNIYFLGCNYTYLSMVFLNIIYFGGLFTSISFCMIYGLYLITDGDGTSIGL